MDLNIFKLFKFAGIIVCGVIGLYFLIQVIKFLKFLIVHRSAVSSIKSLCLAVLKTFKGLDKIENKATLVVKEDKSSKDVFVSLKKSSLYEQNIFNNVKILKKKIQRYLQISFKLIYAIMLSST